MTISESTKTRYVINATVSKVFNRPGTGWFLTLQELHQSVLVGDERPELNQGDRVRITIEKDS